MLLKGTVKVKMQKQTNKQTNKQTRILKEIKNLKYLFVPVKLTVAHILDSGS